MFSPASERNKQPILDQLLTILPTTGSVVEVACGSLQHALYFCPHFPSLQWHPTDINPDALAHGRELTELPANLARPIYLDVIDLPWPITTAEVVFAANLLHISPAATSIALFQAARSILGREGLIVLYGPFKVGGQHTSEGNAAFDLDLRARNAAWGIRDRETIESQAREHGFELRETVPMPANNFLLAFKSLF